MNPDRTPTQSDANLNKKEVQALKHRDQQLRSAIKQFVLDEESDLPDVESVRQARAEHHRLTDAVHDADQRTERLSDAKRQVEPLEKQLQRSEQDLATARGSLAEFHRPLGRSVFAGRLLEQIAEQSVLADRMAVHEKIEQLRRKSDSLTPSGDATRIAKTKAKALQLIIAGNIKLEETWIGKLETQIGQQLINDQQEEAVHCDATGEIRNDITERRAEIAEKQEQAKHAAATLESAKQGLCQKLDLPQIEDSNALGVQLANNKNLVAGLNKQLCELERVLPDLLLADESLTVESQLGAQVTELRGIQSQLETVRPSAALLLDKAKSLSTPVKLAIGGVLLCGLVIFGTFGISTEQSPHDNQIEQSAHDNQVSDKPEDLTKRWRQFVERARIRERDWVIAIVKERGVGANSESSPKPVEVLKSSVAEETVYKFTLRAGEHARQFRIEWLVDDLKKSESALASVEGSVDLSFGTLVWTKFVIGSDVYANNVNHYRLIFHPDGESWKLYSLWFDPDSDEPLRISQAKLSRYRFDVLFGR